MEPKISVIVPFYNRPTFLTLCIDSVLRQTHKNIEIILVDDGSDDCSVAIAEGYVGLPGISLVRIRNSGAGEARNVGIERAVGDYLTFVDSDDVVHPSLLARMCSEARRHNADIVAVNKKSFSGQCDSLDHDIGAFRTVKPLQLLENGVSINGRLFHRSLFDNFSFRFPKGLWAEDTAYVPFLVSKAEHIRHSSSIGYAVRSAHSDRTSLSWRFIQDLPKSVNALFSTSCDREILSYISIRAINAGLHALCRHPSTTAGMFREFVSDSEFKAALDNIREVSRLADLRHYKIRLGFYALLIYAWANGLGTPAKKVFMRKYFS